MHIKGPVKSRKPLGYMLNKVRGTNLRALLGRVSDETVLGLLGVKYKFVGNGSAYGEVSSITDGDLPTNYAFNWKGELGEINDAGFFGFDSFGADEFQCYTVGLTERIQLEIYGLVIFVIVPGLMVGDDLDITVSVSGNSAVLIANGVSSNGSFSKSLSNRILQLLTRGQGVTPSIHSCYTFTLTNTDTGEDLVKYDFSGYTGLPSSIVPDLSGNGNDMFIVNDDGDRIQEQ